MMSKPRNPLIAPHCAQHNDFECHLRIVSPYNQGMTLSMASAKSQARRCALLVAAWSAIPARSLLSGARFGTTSSSRTNNDGGRHHAPAPAGWGSATARSGGGDNGCCASGREQRRRLRDDAIVCFSAVSTRQNSRPVSTDELTAEAKARATALVEAYVPTEATAGDLRCIEERQLRHKAGTLVTVSPPCRFGFPQAFAFDPCGHKVSSGLFRLSCPKLVQAIDELEDAGGIEEVNARLEQEEDLREDFMAVNLAHGMLRRRMVTPEQMATVEGCVGKEGLEPFLESGITGVTPGKVRDAKCLHAHVADALMRGRGANAIGRATLDLLESRGVNTSGGDRCFEQCDYTAEETKDSWRYTPQKNKQRLQLKKRRRKAMEAPGSKLLRDRDIAAAVLAGEGDSDRETLETKRESQTERQQQEEEMG